MTLRFPALACLAAAALAAGQSMARADEAGVAAETRAALEAALERAGRLEQETAQLRQANAALAKSLAAANQEARTARAEQQKLRSDLEALGLTVFDPTDRESRRRLINAMAELGREKEARALLERQLLQLSESVLVFLDRQDNVDPALRAEIEGELRAADQTLATSRGLQDTTPAAATELTEARVLSLQPELGLAVLNVGTRSGVRLGMPFDLRREDRVLGSAIVVDVREEVCGLVALDGGLAIAELRVGDTARPGIH